MPASTNNPAIAGRCSRLLEATPASLRHWCEQLGESRYRGDQIIEWLFRHHAGSFDQMTNLPKRLRAALAEQYILYDATVVREQAAADRTRKLLLDWSAGGWTECVLIADGPRRTACISAQVGCPVECAFCASGIGGLERNLCAAEIIEQAMRLAALAIPERLSHVVFMGIGEPLANYDATVAAVRTINAEWGMNVAARRITVSTIGLPGRIRQLADEGLQITLALSLHAPTDELRRRLVPWARSVTIAELTDAARYYFERTGREVTIEYVLLASVNDGPTHARQLAKIARRIRCNVNLIRYNPVPGLAYKRPSATAAASFQAKLRSAGVNVHLRKSRGLDIDAACGQLRRKVVSSDKGAGDGTA